MYMGNLNESINRIKGLMKMIQENDYSSMDELPNKNPDQAKWELESIIMHVMASFAEDTSFYDQDINLSDGYFTIMDDEGEYVLHYDFDVDISSYGSYDPGDYETPPYYEGVEWGVEKMKLTIYDYTSGTEKVLYSGPDISNFEKIGFPTDKKGRTRTGSDIIYHEFDDKINELAADRD